MTKQVKNLTPFLLREKFEKDKITFTNMYASNTGALNYIRQLLKDMKKSNKNSHN